VEFTDEQKRDHLEGKTIKLDGVPDKQGVPSTMYLKFSLGKGRLLTYANDPDKAVTQPPASESQTQVAVNSEDKTCSASRRVALVTKQERADQGREGTPAAKPDCPEGTPSRRSNRTMP